VASPQQRTALCRRVGELLLPQVAPGEAEALRREAARSPGGERDRAGAPRPACDCRALLVCFATTFFHALCLSRLLRFESEDLAQARGVRVPPPRGRPHPGAVSEAAAARAVQRLFDRLQSGGYVCGWQVVWGDQPGGWPPDWFKQASGGSRDCASRLPFAAQLVPPACILLGYWEHAAAFARVLH
jgi:hypothetical protein